MNNKLMLTVGFGALLVFGFTFWFALYYYGGITWQLQSSLSGTFIPAIVVTVYAIGHGCMHTRVQRTSFWEKFKVVFCHFFLFTTVCSAFTFVSLFMVNVAGDGLAWLFRYFGGNDEFAELMVALPVLATLSVYLFTPKEKGGLFNKEALINEISSVFTALRTCHKHPGAEK